MPLVLSKLIVAIEALPLAYLSCVSVFLFAALFTVDATAWNVQAIGLVLLFAIAVASIIAGWRLLLGFLIQGADGIRSADRRWWMITFAGATVAAGAFIACRIPGVVELQFTSRVVWGLQFLQYGACFLLPLIHLQLEYRFRGGANSSRNRAPLIGRKS
jgi:hypothetical protein